MNVYKFTAMLLLVMHALCARAQDADEADTTVSLNELIVAANKVPETRKVVAQQVTVLTQDQIAAAQAQTTAELLSNTAGIFVQKSQLGGGSPVLRGFEANKILLVVDGVRMNNLIYRGGHLQNVITLDNAMLDRTEILYGPSSTVYGSDALGGVIHFYTKKPAFSEEMGKKNVGGSAYSRYSSVNNELTGHVDFNVGGKKFASLTSLTYSSFGDLESGKAQNPFYDSTYGERLYYASVINGVDTVLGSKDVYKQQNTGYKQYDVMQKFAFRPNDQVLHTLNLQFSTSTNIPRYDRLTDPGTGGKLLRYAQWYYGPQQRAMAAYNLDKNDKNSLFQQKHLGINYQNIEESRHNRSFGSTGLAHRVEQVGVLGLNVDYSRTVGAHRLRLGVEHQTNTLKSTAERENIVNGARTPIDTRYPDGINYMLNNAVYASHTWHITDQLTMTDGVRLGFVMLHATFNDTSILHLPFKEVTQNNLVYSGNLGLIFSPSDRWKLSVLASTGFRTPNIDDLAKVFESAPGSLIVPNSNLKPEKTINGEVGLTKAFGSNAIWENTAYYTRFIDAIVTSGFVYNGQDSIQYDGVKSRVLANQNKGTAYIYGFSSGIRANLGQYFFISGGVNYTYGRIDTDSTAQPLDHIPPLLLRAQVTYKKEDLGADFFVNYQGEKALKDYYLNGEDNEQYATPIGMPAWLTLNLRISYRFSRNIMALAGVDNLLDTQYRVFASGINAPGRNVFGTIKVNF